MHLIQNDARRCKIPACALPEHACLAPQELHPDYSGTVRRIRGRQVSTASHSWAGAEDQPQHSDTAQGGLATEHQPSSAAHTHSRHQGGQKASDKAERNARRQQPPFTGRNKNLSYRPVRDLQCIACIMYCKSGDRLYLRQSVQDPLSLRCSS